MIYNAKDEENPDYFFFNTIIVPPTTANPNPHFPLPEIDNFSLYLKIMIIKYEKISVVVVDVVSYLNCRFKIYTKLVFFYIKKNQMVGGRWRGERERQKGVGEEFKV